MAKLSEKYIAGFLDADGCIHVNFKKGERKPLIGLSFSQRIEQDEVLLLIQDVIGGNLYKQEVNGKWYASLNLTGAPAMKALNRIRKHLVIKRHYAEVCMELVNRGEIIDPIIGREFLKTHRRIESLPIPNYPSRKWMAGYVDGDGCFHARLLKHGSAKVNFELASSEWDMEGIRLIHKAFGGGIYPMKGNTHRVSIDLAPSKAKQFLAHFAKYLIIKREQANFILSCAEMGHYRNGEHIKAELKQLKTHEHRLNCSDERYSEKRVAA